MEILPYFDVESIPAQFAELVARPGAITTPRSWPCVIAVWTHLGRRSTPTYSDGSFYPTVFRHHQATEHQFLRILRVQGDHV
jgi:hypothetical protein